MTFESYCDTITGSVHWKRYFSLSAPLPEVSSG